MAQDENTAAAEAGAKPAKPKRVAPHHYIVREPFGAYHKGHRLTDANLIDAAHRDGHARKLIRVSAATELEA